MMTRITGLVAYPNRLTLAGGTAVVVGGRLGSILATSQAFGGAIVQALQAFGIPEAMAQMYRDLIDEGYCLIIVEGPRENIQSAENILQSYRIHQWDMYEFTNS